MIDNKVVWYRVLQHKGCLHNVPVCGSDLTARRTMAKNTSFSCVDVLSAIVLSTQWPLFHFNSQLSPETPEPQLGLSLEISKLFSTLFCLRDMDVFLFVVIKVARVSWSSALGQERSFNLEMYSDTMSGLKQTNT